MWDTLFDPNAEEASDTECHIGIMGPEPDLMSVTRLEMPRIAEMCSMDSLGGWKVVSKETLAMHRRLDVFLQTSYSYPTFGFLDNTDTANLRAVAMCQSLFVC